MKRLVDNRKFQVIEGGGRKPSAWIEIPQTTIGLSPTSPSNPCSFRIAAGGLAKMLEHGHKQPLLDLWALVLGKIPPVNNALIKWGTPEVQSKLKSISSAHACFRGIKRPVGDDDRGFDVYAYITKPAITFKYVPSMNCVVELVEIPNDIVCVTYIRMDYPQGRNLSGNTQVLSRGIITHWELVEADETGLLPIGHKERYTTRIW
jgi:hypothetical protein